MKKLVFLGLFTAVTANAAPFNILDVRQMGMGETGVASAKAGSAALYNPALLSTDTGDKVSIIVPNLAVTVFADEDAIDAFEDIEDENYIDAINDAVESINANANFENAAASFSNNVRGLNRNLGEISGKPITGAAQGMLSVALPNEHLGLSVYYAKGGIAEATAYVSECDSELLNYYADFVDGLNDASSIPNQRFDCSDGETSIDIVVGNELVSPEDNLTSSFLAATLETDEYGISVSREFKLGGVPVSFGVTPKVVSVKNRIANVLVSDASKDSFDLSDRLDANERDETDFNLDFGVAVQLLADSLTLGFVGKNLISNSYDSVEDNQKIVTFDLEPQYRAGVAWDGPLGVSLAADMDLKENKAVVNGVDSQYLNLGAEWDVVNALRIRAGYRENLSESEDSAYTLGFGFNIIAVHLDFAAALGDNNSGFAFQFGVEF